MSTPTKIPMPASLMIQITILHVTILHVCLDVFGFHGRITETIDAIFRRSLVINEKIDIQLNSNDTIFPINRPNDDFYCSKVTVLI